MISYIGSTITSMQIKTGRIYLPNDSIYDHVYTARKSYMYIFIRDSTYSRYSNLISRSRGGTTFKIIIS